MLLMVCIVYYRSENTNYYFLINPIRSLGLIVFFRSADVDLSY